MTRSPFFLMVLLSAAVGVPYLLYSASASMPKFDVQQLIKQKLSEAGLPGLSGGGSGSTGGGEINENAPLAPVAMYTPQEPQLEGPPVFDFGEVIRFDVNRRWVMSRWSRVSVVSSDLDLEGLRIPLVTGTRPDDLAGSLTYYFDKRQRIQRITFEGVTGDERRLVGFATAAFQLKSAPTLGAGLYLSQSWGQTKSALRISLPPVVRSESAWSRLSVLLEINEPRSGPSLSPQFQNVLAEDKQTRRL